MFTSMCMSPERAPRQRPVLYCTHTVLYRYVRVRFTPTRGMAHPWHEDAGDNMKMDLALGETMSIIKKHEKQYGETLDMTVRRRRGGKKAKNRMNQVIVLTLHSQGTTSGRISLPR